MIGVLIVDDEIWVRKGIIKNISWEETGLKLVAEASDGDEALEKAREFLPEIIITDMRMPGMDGRELIKNLKELFPGTLIIVVSGYSDFEYTKEAIVNGVFDYLLKPLKKADLHEVLQKALAQLKKNQSPIYYEGVAEFKREFLSKLICDKNINPGEVDQERLKPLNDLYKASQFVVGICRLNAIMSSVFSTDQLTRLKLMIAEKLDCNSLPHEVFWNVYRDRELVIIIYNGIIQSLNLEAIFGDLMKAIRTMFELDLNFDCGSMVQRIQDLKISYEQALKKEQKRKDGSQIITDMIRFLDENYYHSNISLNDFAREHFLNPDYLSRLFKSRTSKNFIDYLTALRIEKAKKLLIETDNKNYDICRMIGYEDYRYFSQVFRKSTGFTPTEFRRHYTVKNQG